VLRASQPALLCGHLLLSFEECKNGATAKGTPIRPAEASFAATFWLQVVDVSSFGSSFYAPRSPAASISARPSLFPLARMNSNTESGSRVAHESPWGMQATFQFIFICLLATLLYSALSTNPNTTPAPSIPVLLDLDHFLRDIVRRMDKFLDGDASLRPNGLSSSVGVWSLTALISNLLSAALLFITCLFGWKHERAKLRIIVGAFAMLAVVLTIVTAPFLYATAVKRDGSTIPIDAAFAALLIYLCCLATDIVGAIDSPARSAKRASFMAFILGVDVPCIGVTALFSACALYIDFPPEFVVGTVAALFAYYSLAFLLLSTFNWANTIGGRHMIAKLKGNVLVVIALGAALNGVVGTIVQIFKLPIYLDMTGSFIVGAMCGMVPAALSAALGVLILGVTTTPIAIAYIGTAVIVAAVAALLKKYGFMSSLLKTALWSLFFLGPLSTVLSVPITVYLFGGVTFAGSDAITLFFVKAGDNLIEAVVKGAIGFDAIDKGLAAALAYAIYRRIPEYMRADVRQ
jgi:energy-coupling factor transport system substrate-specific component